MPMIDAWMEKLERTLENDNADALADRVARWHARGDAIVLAYLTWRELKAIRATLAALESQREFPPRRDFRAKSPGGK